jgi:hypothetical protein
MYTNYLTNHHLLVITRLHYLRLTSLVRASHDLHNSNDSHLEASLVKVVDVILVNPILSYHYLQVLKLGLKQC